MFCFSFALSCTALLTRDKRIVYAIKWSSSPNRSLKRVEGSLIYVVDTYANPAMMLCLVPPRALALRQASPLAALHLPDAAAPRHRYRHPDQGIQSHHRRCHPE